MGLVRVCLNLDSRVLAYLDERVMDLRRAGYSCYQGASRGSVIAVALRQSKAVRHEVPGVAHAAVLTVECARRGLMPVDEAAEVVKDAAQVIAAVRDLQPEPTRKRTRASPAPA
jgi:hypothetical protein